MALSAHRKEYLRTYQREWTRRRRKEFFNGKQCAHCGSTERLELDHIDPQLKISHNIWNWSEKRREEEIAKCQVLCRPCHWEKTKRDMGWELRHGTWAGYNRRRCRCDLCRDANRRKRAEYRKRTGKR